jgi:hypothetical protein
MAKKAKRTNDSAMTAEEIAALAWDKEWTATVEQVIEQHILHDPATGTDLAISLLAVDQRTIKELKPLKVQKDKQAAAVRPLNQKQAEASRENQDRAKKLFRERYLDLPPSQQKKLKKGAVSLAIAKEMKVHPATIRRYLKNL